MSLETLEKIQKEDERFQRSQSSDRSLRRNGSQSSGYEQVKVKVGNLD
jgi:hypothetical protein